jgi:uncharacterized repeat protein (TIGR02543 family)
MREKEKCFVRFCLLLFTLLVVLIGIIGNTNAVLAGFSQGSEVKLTANDGAIGDVFGNACISGNTMVVGAQGKGAAYVFLRSGSAWTQQAKLTVNDGADGILFGVGVTISGDTIVVGAYGNSGKGTAYVFVRSGSAWTQQAKLTASDGATGDYFYRVSISGDTVVVGAQNNSGKGAAYVFVRSGSAWTQQAKLTASDGATGDYFGGRVSISDDTVVVGASGKDSYKGAAYVFVRSGSAWTQQAKLTSNDGIANDSFGFGAGVSGDTIVVGAYGKDNKKGAAYIFMRSGSAWAQQAKLTASDGVASDQFGVSVAISGDTMVVGANGKDSYKGAAYVFVYRTVFLIGQSPWYQQVKLTASDGATGDNFGDWVHISGDTAVVDAQYKDNGKGVGYVYTNTNPPAVSTSGATSVTTTSATLNGSLTSLGTAATVSVFFEYGTDTNYGKTTIAQVVSGTGAFSANITTGLTQGATYHFRAKADGGVIYGMATGLDMTFTTPAAPGQYSLTINTVGSGTTTGAGPYNSGTVVTLNATPASGWQFVGWTGDAAANNSSASTTITMNGNKTITANFSQISSPGGAPSGWLRNFISTTPTYILIAIGIGILIVLLLIILLFRRRSSR